MNCQQAARLLEPYADQELGRDQVGAVEKHLSDCSACRMQYSELLEIRATLDTNPRIKASPDFDMRVLDAVLPQLAKSDSFFDRLDAIFARPLYKLLGSGTIGAGIGLLILMAIAPPTPSTNSSEESPVAPISPTLMANLDTTRALQQYYARSRQQAGLIGADNFEWVREPGRPEPGPARMPVQKRSRFDVKEKTPWGANTSALPSSSLPGSLC